MWVSTFQDWHSNPVLPMHCRNCYKDSWVANYSKLRCWFWETDAVETAKNGFRLRYIRNWWWCLFPRMQVFCNNVRSFIPNMHLFFFVFFSTLGQDQSTVAQRAKMTVAECSLMSFVWAYFLTGSHTMPGQQHCQPTPTLFGQGCMRFYVYPATWLGQNGSTHSHVIVTLEQLFFFNEQDCKLTEKLPSFVIYFHSHWYDVWCFFLGGCLYVYTVVMSDQCLV